MDVSTVMTSAISAAIAALLTHLAALHREREAVKRARGIDAANAFIRSVTLLKHTIVGTDPHDRLTLPVADMEAAQRLIEIYFPHHVTEAAQVAGDSAYGLFQALDNGETIEDLQGRMLEVSEALEFFTWVTHDHLKIRQPRAPRR